MTQLQATTSCWAFEAGSIQNFLFETGRLADAVGASLLVDRLTGDLEDVDDEKLAPSLLSCVMEACGVELEFSRRSGGAFIAFHEDTSALERVRALWHMALRVNAPGLRYSDAVAAGVGRQQAAKAALQACQVAARFDPPRLPEASPVAMRVGRTGHPAEQIANLGAKGREPIDAATALRRRHGTTEDGLSPLLLRFTPDSQRETGLNWPNNMDGNDGDRRTFPFFGRDREVALIHADGNGLGSLLRVLSEKVSEADYQRTYSAFSSAIARATRGAAREASTQVLWPARRGSVMPARPLVLGGDDVSVIVRADLALEFTTVFLQEFAQRTAAAFKESAELRALELPGLTAAAGIAVVNASHPFMQASELAEDLCKRAKNVIKREKKATGRSMPLSALALQHITSSSVDVELPSVEWSNGNSSMTCVLGHEAYVLTPAKGEPPTTLPRWTDLKDLAELIGSDGAPRGPVRSLLIDLHQDAAAAVKRYQLWRERRGADLPRIDAALKALGVTLADAPLGPAGSPWPDALLVAELTRARERARVATVQEDDEEDIE